MKRLAILLLALPIAANAIPITYDVNRVIGAGTVVGTVETDGTLGVLDASNFIGWNLTLSSPNLPGLTDVITDANSTVRTGGGVIASLTDLIFDFSGGPDWYLIFQQSGGDFNYWCMTTGPVTCNGEAVPSENIGFSASFSNAESRFPADPEIIARSVPEPGTLALFGIGLLGIGLARRRRTQ